MKLKLIAYNPIKFTIVKALRADTDWFAELEKLTTSLAQADAPDSVRGVSTWQSRHWRSESAADDLHRLRARLDAPGDTSCPQLRFLLSRTFLEWARKGCDTSPPTLVSELNSVLARRDRVCLSDTGTNTRSTTLGTWTALVAHHHTGHHHTGHPSTGALSPAAMPTFTRDRSTTTPCELYNDDTARWTVRLHAVAPHSRIPSGHPPWHIQSPAEPPRENHSALRHSLTSTCTCALPGHSDSTPRPGRTADLAGATNRRLLQDLRTNTPPLPNPTPTRCSTP